MTNCTLLTEKVNGTGEMERIKIGAETEKDSLAKERALIRQKIRAGKENRKTDIGTSLTECPECKSRMLEFDSVRAETVCRQCGLVLEENIVDPGPEWRNYEGENNSRTGPAQNMLIHDKGGLTTLIDWKNKDASGKFIPGESFAKMGRLRRLQRGLRIRNPKDKGLSFAFGELNRMSSALALPKSIQVTASMIYRKASDADLIRGRSFEGMMTACLYAACKQHKVSRTLDEITAVSRVSKVSIGRSYLVISVNLKLGILAPSPLEFIPRFCSPFRFSDTTVQIRAEEIIRRAEQIGLTSGKGPEGIAAAAIYIASRIPRFSYMVNQKQLAKIAGVTEVTIRTRYKELIRVLRLDQEDA